MANIIGILNEKFSKELKEASDEKQFCLLEELENLNEDGRQSAEAKFKRADTIRRKYRDSLSTDELEKQSKDANSKLGKLTTNVDKMIPELEKEMEDDLVKSQYESLLKEDTKNIYEVTIYDNQNNIVDWFEEVNAHDEDEAKDMALNLSWEDSDDAWEINHMSEEEFKDNFGDMTYEDLKNNWIDFHYVDIKKK